MKPFVVPILLLLIACLLAPDRARAQEPTSFDEANKLYEQGEFDDAIRIYENLADSGQRSFALMFNLGNAHFQAGRPGLAIAAYYEAARINPRDPDLRANLLLVRDRVTGGEGHLITTSPLHRLSANEWLIASTLLLWLLFGLLTFQTLRAGKSGGLRALIALLALLELGVGTAAFLRVKADHEGTRAVVISGEAVVRYGPLPESQSAFTANDGTELETLDRKDDWVQVRDRRGRVGWVQRSHLFIPGAPAA